MSSDWCLSGDDGAVRRVILGLCLAALVSHSAAAQPPPRPSLPITRQQAVQHATEHYPAIRASAARVAARESGVDLAQTSYLPRLDSSLQLNRATCNNVAGLLLPGTNLPAISGPVSDTTSSTSASTSQVTPPATKS